MHKRFSIIIMFLFLGSCAPVYTSYQVSFLKPAEIDIPQHIDTLVLVNRLAQVSDTNDDPNEYKELRQILSLEAYFSLYFQLLESPRFSELITVNLHTPYMNKEINTEELQEICDLFHAHALILLDDLDYSFSVKRYYSNDYHENAHIPLNPNDFIYDTEASLRIRWKLYDAIEKENTDVKNEELFSSYSESSQYLLYPGQGLADTLDFIHPMAHEAGKLYAKRIGAFWNPEERYFFNRGSKEMRIATRLLFNNLYDSALFYWENNTEHPQKKIAARNSFNTAFGYELLGDLIKARMWALGTYRKYNLEEARNYANILYQRINDWKEIQKQIPDD
jgi:hypothetical protein